jgi:hypothetical protein
MVRQEEARSGRTLFPKLRVILMMLSPPSHSRMLMGLPPLVGNFRSALVWAFDRLSEEDLARIVLPALRGSPADLELVLYATAVAAPHDGRRLSALRLVALRLHDLPEEDAGDTELVVTLAQPPDEMDTFFRERECFVRDAKRVLGARAAFPKIAFARTTEEPPPVGTARLMGELVRIASETPQFERFYASLPKVTARLAAEEEGIGGIVKIVQGLQTAQGTAKTTASEALTQLATPTLIGRALDHLEAVAPRGEGPELADAVALVKALAAVNFNPVWDRLERPESEAIQQILIDALAAVGPPLLPFVRGKLRHASWRVIRHAVALVPRVGGMPRDFAIVAKHPEERVRAEILRALRSIAPDETTMDLVIGYLTDASQDLRHAARSMLRAELLTSSGVAELERVADDTTQPEALRRRCIEVLGRSTLEPAAEALFRLLQPRSLLEMGTLREHAAVALRSSPSAKAAELFRMGLESSVRRVRKACERAAGGT